MTTDLEDYSLARVIKGIYDSEYKTIATDDEGNIIGVFKGQYGTELITIKTDSSGRMLAIITDPEDVYGNVHQLGNAELAARLGCLSRFDRRGSIFFMDDMENSLGGWLHTTTGTGAAVNRSITTFLTGMSSCKLKTGNADNNIALILRYLPYSALSKTGIEINFSMPDDLCRLSLTIDYYTPTETRRYMVTVDKEDSEIQLATPDGNYTAYLTSFEILGYEIAFDYLKLVFDPTTKKYERLIINETEYNISSYSSRDLGTTDVENMNLSITLQAQEAANKHAYINNIIVTKNEP